MVVIGVISAKGGVGKTTAVANIASALVKDHGKKVLVIDGNITMPTLGIHLGMLSQEKTLHDVLEGNIKFRQATYVHQSGLHVVPASLSPKERYPDPERLKEKLSEVNNKYDVILIDGAAGIGREVISAIQVSDSVLVVANPEMTSVLAAIKAIKIAKSMGAPVLGVVLNKATRSKHDIKLEDVEDLCETKVIATVPYDKKIIESIREMDPVVLYDEKAPSSFAFRSVAAQIIGEEPVQVKVSILDRIANLFRSGLGLN